MVALTTWAQSSSLPTKMMQLARFDLDSTPKGLTYREFINWQDFSGRKSTGATPKMSIGQAVGDAMAEVAPRKSPGLGRHGIALLKSVPLFSQLSHRDLRHLAAQALGLAEIVEANRHGRLLRIQEA